MRREKCLATEAKQNIEICCTTLCDKETVIQYIKQLEDENELLRRQITSLNDKIYAQALKRSYN